jgi:hypothetical protein
MEARDRGQLKTDACSPNSFAGLDRALEHPEVSPLLRGRGRRGDVRRHGKPASRRTPTRAAFY